MDRQGFLERLTEYGDKARATLLERLPQGEPEGYLYAPIRDYVSRAGKGLRPALMMATCGAFGGDVDKALTSAAALELLHNAFLIHDDIEDESEFRRGVPCMHARLGVPIAINAGDAMQAIAFRLLRRNIEGLGPHTAWRVFDEFDHLLTQSLEGQALELGWIRDNSFGVGADDYLRMCLKKTCWYSFIHPCRIGALIARPDDPDLDLDAFNAFGFYLGAAFQIQDDVLNLAGTREAYGKEIGGDIQEGKRTLMLVRLADLAAPTDRSRLTEFLATPRLQRQPGDIAWVHGLMERHGTIDFARRAARSLADSARVAFERAFASASGDDRAFVAQCLDYMIERDR
jgi:geranylgeranyl diphosphate synthase type II